MSVVELEDAVAEFLALGERLLASASPTGREAFEALASWYRQTRVEGAPLEAGADMLLVQWGASRPPVVEGPTDLREVRDGDLRFGDEEVVFLDIARQVFPVGDDDDDDFDEAAVQMSVLLGFARAEGGEPDANHWITTPDEVDEARRQLREVPLVASLLDAPARGASVTVGHCG